MKRGYLKRFKLTKDYLEKSIKEIFPTRLAEQYLRNNEDTLRRGEPVDTIDEAMIPNGEIRTFKVTKFPIYANEETLVGGWAPDISEDLDTFDYLKEKRKKM